MAYRFGVRHSHGHDPDEMYSIACELSQLGLKGTIDLDNLGGAGGNDYAQRFIQDQENNPRRIKHLVTYLLDVRNQLLTPPHNAPVRPHTMPRTASPISRSLPVEMAGPRESPHIPQDLPGPNTTSRIPVEPTSVSSKEAIIGQPQTGSHFQESVSRYSTPERERPAGEATPQRSQKRRRIVGTPMTAPHKIASSISGPGIEVLRVRDKFYTRVPLFREFLKTPQRSSRAEAEGDHVRLTSEIEKYRSDIENPSISEADRNIILIKVAKFIAELSVSSSSATSSSASTPQPQRRISKDIEQNDDGKYQCILKLYRETLLTHPRDTPEDALSDKAKCEVKLKNIHKILSSKKNGHHSEDTIIRSMKQFIESLAPPRERAPMHRIRDQVYSAVEINGKPYSTPMRQSEALVRQDVAAAYEMIEQNRSSDWDQLLKAIYSRWASM